MYKPKLSLLILALFSTTLAASAEPNAKDMFYQQLKSPDAASGSVAYSLELRRGSSQPVACNNRFQFKSGDGIRLHLRSSFPAYAYIALIGSSGKRDLLYPTANEPDNHLDAGKECVLPRRGMIVFDNNPGCEHLYIVLSRSPIESARAFEQQGMDIDSNVLTGMPQAVGELNVVSDDGYYELGKQAPGSGLVYVSTADTSKPLRVMLSLNHSDASSQTEATSSKPSETGSTGESPTTQVDKPTPVADSVERRCDGIIPPFVLEDIAQRHPESNEVKSTINTMRTMRHFSLQHGVRGGGDDPARREIYDANCKELREIELPGDKARFEGEEATRKWEIDKTYEYEGYLRDFYKEEFNRNSIDGNGMKLVSTANFGSNFWNAFWDGKQMIYGHTAEGSPISTFILLDICGHEMTHGVTEAESHLEYYGQAGALNESLSDVFGELIQQRANHTLAKEADWIVGNGVFNPKIHGRGVRDMLNPGTAYNDPFLGKDEQVGHMKSYLRTTKDHGGVHLNSGIPNRAFTLFALSVGGYAWERPGHIWYAARAAAGSNPTFASFAFCTLEAAKKLGYSDCIGKLKKAWHDVGVVPSADDKKDTLTPPRQ